MKENKLANLTMDFSVDILTLTESVSGHSSLKNQIERSATSIGANLNEATFGNSKADFISKMHISLKECSESLYWLELFKRVNYKIENIDKLISDCNEIKALLISSINTAKKIN